MENNQTMELAKDVWSEQAMMELLGVNRKQLDNLRREKDFPSVPLTRSVRVYLIEEVLEFVKGVAGRR